MTFAGVRMRSYVFLLCFSTTALTFIALTLGTVVTGQAQTNAGTPKDSRIGSLIETLGRTKTPSSAAISPDGTMVAWAVRMRGGSQIHLTNVADLDPATDKIVGTGSSAANCGSSEPKWSPDGQWLAFVSDCTVNADKPGQEQVFVWSTKTGESKELTHLVGNIEIGRGHV